MQRTTKLSVETRRLLVIHKLRIARRAPCEACGKVVSFVTPNEATELIKTRAISTGAASDRLHVTETFDGERLICLNSLLK